MFPAAMKGTVFKIFNHNLCPQKLSVILSPGKSTLPLLCFSLKIFVCVEMLMLTLFQHPLLVSTFLFLSYQEVVHFQNYIDKLRYSQNTVHISRKRPCLLLRFICLFG